MQPNSQQPWQRAHADVQPVKPTPATLPRKLDHSETAETGKSVLPLAYALWSFACTITLAPYYTGGDQVYYRAFYESREGTNLVDSFADYVNILGSSEPGYFLIVSVFSQWIPKDVLMSLLNAVFGYYLGRGLVAINASRVVAALLAFNYYMFVLYLSADRLKVGLLFLLIGIAYAGLPRYLAFLFGVLSHVQNLVLVVGKLLASLVPAIIPFIRGRLRATIFWAPIGLLLLAGPLFFLREHIEGKLQLYLSGTNRGWISLLKPLLFVFCTAAYAPGRRIEAVAIHLPILVGAALVGVERLVLFSYFVFLYYGIQVRRGLNFGVLTSSAYFALTGLVFVSDVVVYGNGFHWNTAPIMRLLFG